MLPTRWKVNLNYRKERALRAGLFFLIITGGSFTGINKLIVKQKNGEKTFAKQFLETPPRKENSGKTA